MHAKVSDSSESSVYSGEVNQTEPRRMKTLALVGSAGGPQPLRSDLLGPGRWSGPTRAQVGDGSPAAPTQARATSGRLLGGRASVEGVTLLGGFGWVWD